MKERVLSVLLALMLCLGVAAPVAAFAAEIPNQTLDLRGDAYYDEERDQYVLTEEKTWQGGALWFSQVKCNDDFALELDFYTGHGTYTNSYGGADGICVAFYADGSKTGAEGGGLGFEGCGGYGVQIDTFYNSEHKDPSYNHIAIIRETISNHLTLADATSFTEDGKWHHLRIVNRDSVCTVYVDGERVLRQEGVEPNGQYQIGISAATGSGYNFHAVKNIFLNEAKYSDWFGEEIEDDPIPGPPIVPDILIDADLTQPITRLEFAAVCVKVFENLSGTKALPDVTNPFTDTTDPEVLKAYNVGITNGTSETTFSPNALLNREQCATMLTRVFKRATMAGWTLPTDDRYKLTYSMPAPFADDALISEYARDSVYFMAANGIIQGKGNNLFVPRNTTSEQEAMGYANATREQALAIAMRMVRNLK